MNKKKKRTPKSDVKKALTLPDVDVNLQDYLRGLYPDSFEGWDGFECSVRVRVRKDEDPQMLILILNSSDSEYTKVALHAAFYITVDNDGNEDIRVGMHELVKEFVEVYIPGLTI